MSCSRWDSARAAAPPSAAIFAAGGSRASGACAVRERAEEVEEDGGGGGAPRALSQREQDIQMMLAADVHLGTKNCDFQMERYVYKRRSDGIFIINLGKTWEKLQLAARVIVAIENPQDIIVQSARPYGQRAVLKFAQYTGAHAIAGRHTPGTFTNQLQTSFSEPRLLILTDPRTDHQPIKESALGNIPTIAFCDTDSPMRYVDIGIPANNKGKQSIGCLFWLLARMVLQMRGTILPGHKWDVMVDLFFYRDPEEAKEQEEEEAAVGPEYAAVAEYGAAPTDNWGDQQWGGEVQPPALPAAPTGEWGAAPGWLAALIFNNLNFIPT
jgi:small subunit ribosomal protein SAe